MVRLSHFLEGCEHLRFKPLATPAIFYSHWQLEILKAVLRQKSKAVALIARCPQYLQRVNTYMSHRVQRDEYSATLSQLFCCRICPWLQVQHFAFTIPATSERTVVFPVSKDVPGVAAALGSSFWCFERFITISYVEVITFHEVNSAMFMCPPSSCLFRKVFLHFVEYKFCEFHSLFLYTGS